MTLLVVVFLTCSGFCTIQADTSSPMFAGSTLSIDGTSYTWMSASEDETYHTDYYSAEPSGSVTVTGLTSNTNLATVSGTSGASTINGYISSGTYASLYVEHTSGGSYNHSGYDYYWVSGGTSYSVDLMSGTVSPTSVSNTYGGTNGSFTVETDGTGMTGFISGAENGYVVNGGMYVNWYTTMYSPQSGISVESWFGGFYFNVGASSTIYDSAGNATTYWSDNYNGQDGGWLHLNYDPFIGLKITGWDPYVGDLNGDWSGSEVIWNLRSSPTFAPAQLWVNGGLVEWQSGTLATNGVVVDHYTGQGAVVVEIIAEARAYQLSGQTANVTVNGSQGTYVGGSSGSGFNVNGYDIQVADPNRSSPLFTGSTLWVNGTEYLFTGGYEVESARTDTYGNPSTGGFTIAGATGDPNSGTINGSHYDADFSGTYDGNGVFSTGTVEIHDYAPVSGAPAIWINGVFYTRVTQYSNTYNGAAGASVTLGEPNQTGLTVSGTDGTATLTGTYPSEGTGLFFLSRGGFPVPACPANLDGTLLLSGQIPPQGLPPAVSVPGYGILQFIGIGTIEEATAAYYMNAAGGSQQNSVLLSIRADSGAVSMKDYAASTNLLGSYDIASHLFQTGIVQSLPMPVFGVDPNSNNALWDLLNPPANRPATLVVGGDIWRYTGIEQDGSAAYLGYYTGQKLTIGAAPGTNGLVSVILTDPIGGNSTGTYNDVRNAFEMDNGLTVYRGDLSGDRIIDTPDDLGNLHTIAADLDVTGNLLSLGSLSTDASFAGVTFQFIDDGTTATLSSALARPSAEWLWSRVSSSSSSEAAPMMKLDSAHRLNLYDPGSPAVPGIVLNPTADGTSRFKGSVSVEGVLRVRPAGDLQMGEFQNGPQP